METRTKVKVRKWIDTSDIRQYEKFVLDWHFFLKYLEQQLDQNKDPAFANKVSMYVLKNFYLVPYNYEEDFYSQFEKRLENKRLEASTFL